MRDRKKRNIIIGALCCLLVFMGIGYAVLSQTLNISGTANMRGTWDIKITDISEASRTGKADPGTPTISTSGVSASFEANLWMPGDSITYNITVKNNGNIDAALKELVPSVENGVQQVKFSNNAVQGKVLRQKESYTFQVSVVFDEDATEIPQDSKTNPPKYTISLTFVQYTGNSLYTPTNETTDNSCFIMDTGGTITGYDYNCGTVVTVPAEIDGIQVKSITSIAFAETSSYNVWMYGKEESAELIKTYLIFKDQEARSLYLEDNGITQEELDAEENTYNYLKGDTALQNIDLGIFVIGMNIFRNSTGKIITDPYGNVALTELDLSHADYLENVECLDWVPNLKTLNLNSTSETLKINNTINHAYFFNNPYLNYQDDNINETLEQYIKTLDLLVVNADNFATLRSSGLEMLVGNQKIKTLIVLDGKNKHTIESSNLFQSSTSEIKNVIIDDGIVEIKNGVFSRHSIEHVTLPATLKTIGSYTFEENKLTSLTIPAYVETIGSNAFEYNQLTTINFESNSKLKTIGEYAFSNNQLTSLTIPASVETIGANAFNSSQITTINFESNSKLKTIGFYAFGNNQLTNTGLSKLPSSLISLDTTAFNSNTNLTQITLTSPKDLEGWPNGGTVDGKTVTYER